MVRRRATDAGMDMEAETADGLEIVTKEADASEIGIRETADGLAIKTRETEATVPSVTAGRDALATTVEDRTDVRRKTAAEEERPAREAIAMHAGSGFKGEKKIKFKKWGNKNENSGIL